MPKLRRGLFVSTIVLITIIMLMPAASAWWWTANPPLITDHSLKNNPPCDPDVKIQLDIIDKNTFNNNRQDFTGQPIPGEQVQIVAGEKFVWTCHYDLRAQHRGQWAPPDLQCNEVRVYLHYFWCPWWKDGNNNGNYQLLHSNWVQLHAGYDEDIQEEGMLHGIHQNHNHVVGEHYCAELSWYTQWSDGTWHKVVDDDKLYYYEII